MNDKELLDRYTPISEAIEMAQDLRAFTPGQVRIAAYVVAMGGLLVAMEYARNQSAFHELESAAETMRVMFFKLARQAEAHGDLP